MIRLFLNSIMLKITFALYFISYAKRAHVALYGDRITVELPKGEPLVLPFSALSGISALGRKKINLYLGKQVYQFKGDASFNGLKYVHLYHRYKNISKGDYDGKFLGL